MREYDMADVALLRESPGPWTEGDFQVMGICDYHIRRRAAGGYGDNVAMRMHLLIRKASNNYAREGRAADCPWDEDYARRPLSLAMPDLPVRPATLEEHLLLKVAVDGSCSTEELRAHGIRAGYTGGSCDTLVQRMSREKKFARKDFGVYVIGFHGARTPFVRAVRAALGESK